MLLVRHSGPLVFCALLVTAPNLARAQTSKVLESAAPAGSALPAEPGSDAAPADPQETGALRSASADDVAANALPDVQDPMLAALASPPHQLSSWRQALRLVRSRSTSLATAQAQVEQAAAQARLALSRAYPSLTASGSVNRHLLLGTGTNLTADGPQINVAIPDPSTVWSASLALRQPIINLQTWHDSETAKVRVRAQELRVADSERIVLANVADTIVVVVTAERLVEVSRVSLKSSLSMLDLTRRRARLGAAGAIDVLRADQEVSLNRAQLIAATESLQRSREALGMALGYAEPWGISPEVRLDELGQDAQSVCRPVTGMGQRTDVAAARVEVQAAKREVSSSDYELVPTVDMTSNLTYTTAPFTPNGKPLQWTVGGLLTIPVYDGGARYADKGAKLAAVRAATERWTQAKRQAELEVRQAMRGVQVAQRNFEVSQKSRQISAETARLSRISFANGKATSFELVDATRRQQQAELDLTVKEFDVVRAKIIALLAQSNCEI